MPDYYMKNWSWRPYFLENIMKMRFENKARLSDLYADIETEKWYEHFLSRLMMTTFIYRFIL